MTVMQSGDHLRQVPRFPASLLAATLAFAFPSHATDLQSYGGKGGDSGYRLECPPGALLAGFVGHAGTHVSHLNIECRRRDGQNKNPGDAGKRPLASPGTVSAGRALDGALRHKTCPSQQIIYTVNFLFARNGPAVLDWLRAGCMDPGDSPQLATSFDFPGSDVAQLGDSPLGYPGSGWQSCPPGELPAGIYGTSRIYVDSIGLICRPTAKGPSVPEQDFSGAYLSPFGTVHPATGR